jgi:hypothetical protein
MPSRYCVASVSASLYVKSEKYESPVQCWETTLPCLGLLSKVRLILRAMRSLDWIWDVSDSGSISTRMRSRRWALLGQTFPDLSEMRVLDLGGTVNSWRLAPAQPKHLTLLNPVPQDTGTAWATSLVGDACAPPASLTEEHFDLVYSNSVLEHIGGHFRREQFSEVVHEAADHHWVQTPYRYFPIEPHWVFPWFQHLPPTAQTTISRVWPLGNYGSIVNREETLPHVLDIELLDMTQMRHYFPGSKIAHERVMGLTKSLIAFR